MKSALADISRTFQPCTLRGASNDGVMIDSQLLMQYRIQKSAELFSQLYDRFVPIVYSTALRILNDPSAAEDATQTTFFVFCRCAEKLPQNIVLSGWFYLTAQHCSQAIRRAAVRRSKHERRAGAMSGSSSQGAVWDSIRPELDSAIAALPEGYRDALVLRYLRGLSVSETARTIGCSDATLHKRLSRGLSKLRVRLEQRGLGVTAVSIGTLLDANAVHQVPAHLNSIVVPMCTGQAPAPASVAAAADVVAGLKAGAASAALLTKVSVALLVVACAIGAKRVYDSRISVSPSAAVEAPANGSAAQQPAYRDDFETGMRAAPWSIGAICSENVLAPGRYNLKGESTATHAYMSQVAIDRFIQCTANTFVEFDVRVARPDKSAWIWFYNGTQKLGYAHEVRLAADGAWQAVQAPLTAFVADGGGAARTQPGDHITYLRVSTTSEEQNWLQIDNFVLRAAELRAD